MINEKFKEVFELSKQLQDKKNRETYEDLSQIDKKIKSIDEYLKQEKVNQNKEIPAEKINLIENSYLAKDNCKKDNINFDLYLFFLKHTEDVKLDKDYKPLPLMEKNIYEYGAVVSLEDESGYYNISGVFGGIETDEYLAKNKYNALKFKIESTSEEELLDDIKNAILKQINE